MCRDSGPFWPTAWSHKWHFSLRLKTVNHLSEIIWPVKFVIHYFHTSFGHFTIADYIYSKVVSQVQHCLNNSICTGHFIINIRYCNMWNTPFTVFEASINFCFALRLTPSASARHSFILSYRKCHSCPVSDRNFSTYLQKSKSDIHPCVIKQDRLLLWLCISWAVLVD